MSDRVATEVASDSSRTAAAEPGDLHERQELEIERFVGNGYHLWSDDIKTMLGVRRPVLEDAPRWAGRKQD